MREFKDLFKKKSQTIKIYLGTETIDDPFEKNIVLSYLNPVPIKALVADLTVSQVQWKMPGIITAKAKEIIIERRYKTLVQLSQKIEIDGEEYVGWKDNAGSKLQIRDEGGYLRLYIYTPN